MLETPEPKTENRHESTWDHHGSYQWTYFSDEIKQRIQFFLREKLNGGNIEIGGGWYLSYPDSTVVDLSSVCLSHNPAKEKLQFDMDKIGEGVRLPYDDDSFNSATFVSSWQYFRHPEKVLGELERVLKPGAEMYLINGQGAGLSECIVGKSRTKDLREFFSELGYDTLIENIPAPDGDVNGFQSLCVAMPDVDLFGDVPSVIFQKEQRQRENEEVREDPSIFKERYVNWEMGNQAALLRKLSTFPVTEYSQEYLARIEAFSQECREKTGSIPLIFSEHHFEPSLATMTPEHKNFYGTLSFMQDSSATIDRVDKILDKFDVGFSRYFGYFKHSTPESLLDSCAELGVEREKYLEGDRHGSELTRLASFVSAAGLNSFTRDLQNRVYNKLSSVIPGFDAEVKEQKALGYRMAARECKQKRNIESLIEAKDRILSDNVPIVGMKSLDYVSMLPRIRDSMV